ncbi:hypothetical protein Cdeb_02760 [Caldibacillus debilis GB1]|jgi:hypothetical protein|uniref:Uncharacterized protein n=1 Tax=Caldibacillus debilis GB1 TaxID=1339248 RepID=A0A420VJF1_9BACI|nr:hypothetical protein Cdeb_02760 [Caldibacillus debilis GB1]
MGKRTERSGNLFASFCMDAGRRTGPFQGRSVGNGISFLPPTVPSVGCPFNGKLPAENRGFAFYHGEAANLNRTGRMPVKRSAGRVARFYPPSPCLQEGMFSFGLLSLWMSRTKPYKPAQKTAFRIRRIIRSKSGIRPLTSKKISASKSGDHNDQSQCRFHGGLPSCHRDKRVCIPRKRFLWRTAKGAPSLGFPVPAYAASWTEEEGK